MKFLTLVPFLLYCLRASHIPFQVYWNVPSGYCKNVQPENYSIITNSDRLFNGDKLVIFYSFGALPFCNERQLNGLNTEVSECDSPVNGGVPQAANLSLHFEQITIDIDAVIPNKSFDGLAIIDYEAWRPVYDINTSSRRVYQRYSEKLAAQQCPNCTTAQIKDLARRDFENSAKKFLLSTVQFAKKLRPNAKFGFFEFPLCNSDAGYDLHNQCSEVFREVNRKLKWLYEAIDILLPKIYLYNFESEVPYRRFHIFASIREALRVKEKQNLPIFAYSKMEYDVVWNESAKTVEDLFYTKTDTCNTIKYPMELGIDGIIIWGTSFKMAYRCDKMHDYLIQILGPSTDIVVNEARTCSLIKCAGKGRCVANIQTPSKRCLLGLQKETHCVDF